MTTADQKTKPPHDPGCFVGGCIVMVAIVFALTLGILVKHLSIT